MNNLKIQLSLFLLLVLLFHSHLHAIEWRGQYVFASLDAETLTVAMKMDVGVHSSQFVGGVGGISFDQVAKPENGLKVKSIQMDYAPENADGSRLQLSIDGKSVHARIHDWLLIPISKYADSPYYSCFTLFGRLKDAQLAQKIRDANGHILNYHPRFTNTLIGLRLFHADILILYDHTIDLPQEQGRYILGNGERTPDVLANRDGMMRFFNYMNHVKSNLKQVHRSYVITDYTRTIEFSIKNDSLVISGNPYYFFWRYKSDDPDYDPQEVQQKIIDSYHNQLKKEKGKNQFFDTQNWVIRTLLDKLDEYEKLHGFYSGGTAVELLEIPTQEERISHLKQYTAESLMELLVMLATDIDGFTVVHLQEMSEEISNRPDLLRQINPAVWDATVATMRWAAFFRYCKAEFPDDWSLFLKSIEHISPEPTVETPTVMYPKEDEEIGEVIRQQDGQ